MCPAGGRLRGPWLAEMTRLAHTGYVIEGRTDLDARDVLRLTMFAPTVTGSPLENACRVIARHERRGRGYYGGAIALVGWRRGRPTLDSAIVIRAADIDAHGRPVIGAGATLVRSSDPGAEADETRAKVAGLLGAFGTAPSGRAAAAPLLGADPRVRRALAARNTGLARFWFADPRRRRRRPDPPVASASLVPRSDVGSADLRGRRVLVVDAEDRFTAMLAQQVAALGPDVVVRTYDGLATGGGPEGQGAGSGEVSTADFDVVVVGPGPGRPP